MNNSSYVLIDFEQIIKKDLESLFHQQNTKDWTYLPNKDVIQISAEHPFVSILILQGCRFDYYPK